MSRQKKGRDVNGFLLLDKPLGYSSNKALQICKRLFDAKKAGHTGTLDPLATGMLVICFGRATKMAQQLLDSDKTYEFTAHLGKTTATGDIEGDVLNEQPVPALTEEAIEAVLTQFRGDISQIPPMYSALKYQGKPLYAWAREGKTVEREPRQITIHALDFLDYQAPLLRLSVHCTKGTYVRTLAEDIGQMLGCGAYVSALRRTTVGQFKAVDMQTLLALEHLVEEQGLAGLDQLLLPV